MTTQNGYNLIRVKNDINGNPRYAIHFLALLSDKDRHDDGYAVALKKSRSYGGRKYHTKHFGGGIVFQCYNTGELVKFIDGCAKGE